MSSMLAVISPAKTLDFSPQDFTDCHTIPDRLEDSQALVARLAKLSPRQLRNLMGISEKLADLNHGRFQEWSLPFSPANAKQAVLAFKGDVYTGLELEEFRKRDFDYAQDHLRILSGLHGILRPLDLIQPYRLEMGTKLKNERGNNLYQFWGGTITEALNQALGKLRGKSKVLVNLASKEYFDSVIPTRIEAPIVTPVFKDAKNGQYKIVSFWAKKARGMMADFIVRERPKKPEDLAAFNRGGYYFHPEGSTDSEYVFLREEGAG